MNDLPNNHSPEHWENITAGTDRDSASTRLPSEEAATLRESWLALGRLLDSANADFDEVELIRKLRLASERRVVIPNQPHARKRQTWWKLVALAAALLLALSGWQKFLHDREPPPRQQANAIENVVSSPDLQAVPPAKVENVWDDAFDNQIADVGERLIYARHDWRGYDARYAVIDEKLSSLSADLGDQTL